VLASILLAILASGKEQPYRVYVGVTGVSASAFELSGSTPNVQGEYVYSYLKKTNNVSTVKTLRFAVQIDGSTVKIMTPSGEQCKPWKLVSATKQLISVQIGDRMFRDALINRGASDGFKGFEAVGVPT
jgi:hypothetical protein